MAEPLIELEPELGPEVEVAARAAPRVGVVAILAVTLGIILSVEAVVRGFFGTVSGAVGWIPYLGSVVEQPIKKIEQKIVSMLSGLEQDIDKALAHNIHVTAALLDKLWHSLELMAANIVLLGALGTAAFFHYIVHPLERWIHGKVREIENEIKSITHAILHEAAKIEHAIEHWLNPRIKAAIVAVPKYIHRDLLKLRKDVNKAQKTATQALTEVESIPFPEGVTTWAAAVAVALPALGLDWLNCKSNPFNRNPNACNLWSVLKDLLGLLGDLAAFSAMCEIIPFMLGTFETIATPIVQGITELTRRLCPPFPRSWAQLNVAPGPITPTRQTLGPIP